MTIHRAVYKFTDKFNLVAEVKNGEQTLIIEYIENKIVKGIDALNCIHTGIILPVIDVLNSDKNELQFKVFSIERHKIDLDDKEKFKAFSSWTQGIAEAGLEGLKLQQEIESISKFAYPISTFLFRFILKYDFDTAAFFIEKIFNECKYENELHYQSLILNLNFIIESILLENEKLLLYIIENIKNIPSKYTSLLTSKSLEILLKFSYKELIMKEISLCPNWILEKIKELKESDLLYLYILPNNSIEDVITNNLPIKINLELSSTIMTIFLKINKENIKIPLFMKFINKQFENLSVKKISLYTDMLHSNTLFEINKLTKNFNNLIRFLLAKTKNRNVLKSIHKHLEARIKNNRKGKETKILLKEVIDKMLLSDNFYYKVINETNNENYKTYIKNQSNKKRFLTIFDFSKDEIFLHEKITQGNILVLTSLLKNKSINYETKFYITTLLKLKTTKRYIKKLRLNTTELIVLELLKNTDLSFKQMRGLISKVGIDNVFYELGYFNLIKIYKKNGCFWAHLNNLKDSVFYKKDFIIDLDKKYRNGEYYAIGKLIKYFSVKVKVNDKVYKTELITDGKLQFPNILVDAHQTSRNEIIINSNEFVKNTKIFKLIEG